MSMADDFWADRLHPDRAETFTRGKFTHTAMPQPTPKQQAVAYAVESLQIGIEEHLGDDYTVAAAISELHALTPACTPVRAS